MAKQYRRKPTFKRVTLADAKSILRNYGMTVNKTVHGEYRVNFRGGSERTAVYENYIEDAINTGIAMAEYELKRQV